jgi:hypothetical protein
MNSDFSTVVKCSRSYELAILKLINLQSLVGNVVEFGEYSPAKFANFAYFCIHNYINPQMQVQIALKLVFSGKLSPHLFGLH